MTMMVARMPGMDMPMEMPVMVVGRMGAVALPAVRPSGMPHVVGVGGWKRRRAQGGAQRQCKSLEFGHVRSFDAAGDIALSPLAPVSAASQEH